MTTYRRLFIPGGTYFFTVALADRSSSLLTERIDDLRAAYRYAHDRHPFETVAMVVLPEHIHCIWTLPEDDADYPTRWRLLKTAFSRRIPALEPRSNSRQAKHERGIWQRRYWEHAVRDEEDLLRHVDYIHFNPVKHGYVGRVGDWPYSTFPRFVARGWFPEDWGGDAPNGAGEEFGE